MFCMFYVSYSEPVGVGYRSYSDMDSVENWSDLAQWFPHPFSSFIEKLRTEIVIVPGDLYTSKHNNV